MSYYSTLRIFVTSSRTICIYYWSLVNFIGGLLLKTPGRVGQAALYACGVWADSFSPLTESSVATCTTGCGEHLVQTHLAKEIAIGIQDSTCPTTALHKLITEKFLSKLQLV